MEEHPALGGTAGARPPGVPAGLVLPARVLELVDADAVCHGLAEGSELARASDTDFSQGLARSRAAALALSGGNLSTVATVIAASTRTAEQHLSAVLASPGNTWRFRRGLDGADHALIDELEALAAGLEHPCSLRRQGCRLPAAVLLVGQDHAYAPTVRRLRLLGCPTWVLQPGRYIAADLYKAACAVTPLVPTLAG
jgi:hypothetical protein